MLKHRRGDNSSGERDGDARDSYDSYEKGSSSPPWLSIPTSITLGCLLLITLWMLYTEKQQVTSARHVVKELKVQVRLMKEEMGSARRIALKAEGASAGKSTEEVKQLEAEKAKLQGENAEVNRKLQEMVNRMALMQSEKTKLLAQIQSLLRDKRICSKKLGLKTAGEGGGPGGAPGGSEDSAAGGAVGHSFASWLGKTGQDGAGEHASHDSSLDKIMAGSGSTLTVAGAGGR